jgi:hypothetical protein
METQEVFPAPEYPEIILILSGVIREGSSTCDLYISGGAGKS